MLGQRIRQKKSYSSGSNVVQYTAGTIQNCTTAQNKTVSGSSNVGGLVGWNLNDGVLAKNMSNAKYFLHLGKKMSAELPDVTMEIL